MLTESKYQQKVKKKSVRRKLYRKMYNRYKTLFGAGTGNTPSGDQMFRFWRVRYHHRNDFMKAQPRKSLYGEQVSVNV